MCKPGQPCHTADIGLSATDVVEAKRQFDALTDEAVTPESDLFFVLETGKAKGGDIQHLGPDDKPTHLFLLNPAGVLTLSAVRTKTQSDESEDLFHVLALPGFFDNFNYEEKGTVQVSL